MAIMLHIAKICFESICVLFCIVFALVVGFRWNIWGTYWTKHILSRSQRALHRAVRRNFNEWRDQGRVVCSQRSREFEMILRKSSRESYEVVLYFGEDDLGQPCMQRVALGIRNQRSGTGRVMIRASFIPSPESGWEISDFAECNLTPNDFRWLCKQAKRGFPL